MVLITPHAHLDKLQGTPRLAGIAAAEARLAAVEGAAAGEGDINVPGLRLSFRERQHALDTPGGRSMWISVDMERTFLLAPGVFSHCGGDVKAELLNYLFVTPEVHRRHHSAKVPEGHGYSCNYGVEFSFWDIIFGTFYLPVRNGVAEQPTCTGILAEDCPTKATSPNIKLRPTKRKGTPQLELGPSDKDDGSMGRAARKLYGLTDVGAEAIGAMLRPLQLVSS